MSATKKKRNEREVSVEILKCLASPKIVTDISQSTNNSHRGVVSQINLLGKMGLVEILPNPDRKSSSLVIQITQKGRKFLELHEVQKEALNDFYKDVDPTFDYMQKVKEIKRLLRKN